MIQKLKKFFGSFGKKTNPKTTYIYIIYLF